MLSAVPRLALAPPSQALDPGFIFTNKITHIVNCAGSNVMNRWEGMGIRYLTFSWADADVTTILDPKVRLARARASSSSRSAPGVSPGTRRLARWRGTVTPAALTKQRARQDSTINRVCHFVDEALENAEGVLIHSVRGSSRSCTILVAYLVKKCAPPPPPPPLRARPRLLVYFARPGRLARAVVFA